MAQSVERPNSAPGHDLAVREFEPHVRLAAVSAERTSDPLFPSPSAAPLLALSQKETNLKKKKKSGYFQG